MEAIAKLNNCPTSPRKMRLVADVIRGKSALEALNLLKYSKTEASNKLYKLLLSAINNWEQKSGASSDNASLYIKTIFVNEGKMMKRFRPAPQGRAYRIRKRSNHVSIILDNKS
jgi:large subunit ribosomal protein L22